MGGFKNTGEVLARLRERVAEIKADEILKDLERFLENREDVIWIKNYGKVFAQAVNKYLAG